MNGFKQFTFQYYQFKKYIFSNIDLDMLIIWMIRFIFNKKIFSDSFRKVLYPAYYTLIKQRGTLFASHPRTCLLTAFSIKKLHRKNNGAMNKRDIV